MLTSINPLDNLGLGIMILEFLINPKHKIIISSYRPYLPNYKPKNQKDFGDITV